MVGIGRYLYNFGFKRNGDFDDLDILSIHPATKEDPTAVGQFATETLRKSKDTYNADLTFSIVYQDYNNNNNSSGLGASTHSHGVGNSFVSTLDIECVSLETYMILFKGFQILEEEAQRQRSEDARGGNSGSHRRGCNTMDPISAMWVQTKAVMSSALIGGKDECTLAGAPPQQRHPVDDLYAPSVSFEPFRALRVGGGLVHKGGLLTSPTRKSLHGNGSAKSNNSPCPSAVLSPNPPMTATINGQKMFPSTINGAPNPSPLPVAQFLGWKSAGTQIWARLKMAGLDVKCVFSWDLSRVILKVRCPKWRLEQMAEQMHMKIKTKDGYLKPFRINRRDTFALNGLGADGTYGGSNIGGGIFRSSERQQIIDYILRSKIKDGGAELDEHTELGAFIVQRFPLHMYSRLLDIRHSWITFWKREKPGAISQPFSIFSQSYSTTWRYVSSSIKHVYDNILNQPLDHIAEYFGETIAFYFAFMSFYTRWLVFPSVLGIIVFGVQMSTRKLDHWLCAPYAIIVMLWVSFMLAFWRQKSSALAYKWGVLDYEVEETERPQFKGKYIYDEFTGEIRKSYPLWRRFVRYLISVPVLCSFILLMLVIMTTTFYSQDLLYDRYVDGDSLSLTPAFPSLSNDHRMLSGVSTFNRVLNIPINGNTTTSMDSSTTWGRQISVDELFDADFWAATFFYPCLYGMLVSILTMLFNTIALALNEFENHRTQTIFLNRLILKVFSFQFVTIFTSLYYYAFFSKDVDGGFTRISVTIFSLMTVGQWWQVFLDICLPSFYHRLLMYRLRSNFAVTNRKIYKVREMIAAMEAITSANAKKALIVQESAKEGRQSTLAVNGISASGSNDDIDLEAAHAAAVATAAKDALLLRQQHEIQAKLEKRIKFLTQAKSKCWEEALQAKYNIFSDYTTLVIQMCFILFFGAVFPLAPLLAFVNNILLIRFKAIKICYTRQRPIAQKIGGIGVWNDVLQILSVGGALTNCALLGFVSTPLRNWLIPSVGQTGLALILFGFEQVLLLFKYWLHTSIPSVPPSVARAQLRERKSLLSKRSWLIQEQEKREKEKRDKERKDKEKRERDRREKTRSVKHLLLGRGDDEEDDDNDNNDDGEGTSHDNDSDGGGDGVNGTGVSGKSKSSKSGKSRSGKSKKGKKHSSLYEYVVGTVSSAVTGTQQYSSRLLSYSPTKGVQPPNGRELDRDCCDDDGVYYHRKNRRPVSAIFSPAMATINSHISPASHSSPSKRVANDGDLIRSPSRSISPASRTQSPTKEYFSSPFAREYHRDGPHDEEDEEEEEEEEDGEEDGEGNEEEQGAVPMTKHPFQLSPQQRSMSRNQSYSRSHSRSREEDYEYDDDLPPEEEYEDHDDEEEYYDQNEEGDEYCDDEDEEEQEGDELESYMLRPPSHSDYDDDAEEDEDEEEDDDEEEEGDDVEEDCDYEPQQPPPRRQLEKQVSFRDEVLAQQEQCQHDEEVDEDEDECDEEEESEEEDDDADEEEDQDEENDNVSALSDDEEEFRGLEALPLNTREGERDGQGYWEPLQQQQQQLSKSTSKSKSRSLSPAIHSQSHSHSQSQSRGLSPQQQALSPTQVPLKSSMKQPRSHQSQSQSQSRAMPSSKKLLLQSTRNGNMSVTASIQQGKKATAVKSQIKKSSAIDMQKRDTSRNNNTSNAVNKKPSSAKRMQAEPSALLTHTMTSTTAPARRRVPTQPPTTDGVTKKRRDQQQMMLQSLTPLSALHNHQLLVHGKQSQYIAKTRSKPVTSTITKEYPEYDYQGHAIASSASPAPTKQKKTKKIAAQQHAQQQALYSTQGTSSGYAYPRAMPLPLSLPFSLTQQSLSASPGMSVSSSSKATLQEIQRIKANRSDRSTRHLFPPTQVVSPFAFVHEDHPQPLGERERVTEQKRRVRSRDHDEHGDDGENSPHHGNLSPSHYSHSPHLSPSPKPMLAGRSRSPKRVRENEGMMDGREFPAPPTSTATLMRSPMRTPIKSLQPVTPSQSHSKSIKRASLSRMQNGQENNPFSFVTKTGQPSKIEFYE